MAVITMLQITIFLFGVISLIMLLNAILFEKYRTFCIIIFIILIPILSYCIYLYIYIMNNINKPIQYPYEHIIVTLFITSIIFSIVLAVVSIVYLQIPNSISSPIILSAFSDASQRSAAESLSTRQTRAPSVHDSVLSQNLPTLSEKKKKTSAEDLEEQKMQHDLSKREITPIDELKQNADIAQLDVNEPHIANTEQDIQQTQEEQNIYEETKEQILQREAMTLLSIWILLDAEQHVKSVFIDNYKDKAFQPYYTPNVINCEQLIPYLQQKANEIQNKMTKDFIDKLKEQELLCNFLVDMIACKLVFKGFTQIFLRLKKAEIQFFQIYYNFMSSHSTHIPTLGTQYTSRTDITEDQPLKGTIEQKNIKDLKLLLKLILLFPHRNQYKEADEKIDIVGIWFYYWSTKSENWLETYNENKNNPQSETQNAVWHWNAQSAINNPVANFIDELRKLNERIHDYYNILFNVVSKK